MQAEAPGDAEGPGANTLTTPEEKRISVSPTAHRTVPSRSRSPGRAFFLPSEESGFSYLRNQSCVPSVTCTRPDSPRTKCPLTTGGT